LFAVTAKLERIILVMPPLHPIFFCLAPLLSHIFGTQSPYLKNERSLGTLKIIDVASFNKALKWAGQKQFR